MANDIDSDDIVELEDEDGQRHTFMIMAIVDNGSQDFAVLSPLEQLGDPECEEVEMFVFRYDELEEDGGIVRAFSPVEDDEQYQKIVQFCLSLPEFQGEE